MQILLWNGLQYDRINVIVLYFSAITTHVIRLPSSTLERPSDLLLDCDPGSYQVDWYLQVPGMPTAVAVNTLINVNMYNEYLATGVNGSILRITGVRPRNEGLYYCESGGGMVGNKQFNVIVLGAPSFVDCSDDNCLPGPPIIVNEGDSFEINALLVFKFAGPRNENQNITQVRVEHFTETIFFCPETYFCIANANYIDRITYTGQRSPSSDISLTISNTVLSDNGTYRMLLGVFNPNGKVSRTLTSSAIVSVTQGRFDYS